MTHHEGQDNSYCPDRVQSRLSERVREPLPQTRQSTRGLIIRRQPIHQSRPRLPFLLCQKKGHIKRLSFQMYKQLQRRSLLWPTFDFTIACTMWMCWYHPSVPLNIGSAVFVHSLVTLCYLPNVCDIFPVCQCHPVRYEISSILVTGTNCNEPKGGGGYLHLGVSSH